ncbi:CPBP family intramembrane glutamic endopeptidase [Halomicrococcus sp. SG-WS-1]|uniref:CPBP family intramembrane glutamic endopeptidase n=1 Tax=Halomicrococcus sp. SG-WS-1 TaxID=3439057 RepID=UPI003F79190D
MEDSTTSERGDSTAPGENGLRGLARRHQTTAFFLVTLLVSWGCWALTYVALPSDELTQVHFVPGAFGPMIAAALVTWASGGDLRAWAAQIVDWRVSPRWYLVALGLPIVLMVGGVTAGVALAGASLDASVLTRRLPQYPVGLLFVLLVGGGQEEPGWRGFALPRLQETYSSLTASLIVGGVWAVWHLPLYVMGFPRNETGSFLLYALLVVGVSILLTWCYNSTGGSVLLAMLFHASVNTSGGLLPVREGVAEQWPLVVDGALIIAIWLAAVAVVSWNDAESLSRRGIPDPRSAGVESDR